MAGLMRYQHSNILSSISSRARRQSAPPTALVAFACLLVGFMLGCHQTRDPYPLEKAAFLPPPDGAHQQQQRQPPAQAHSQASFEKDVVKPPELSQYSSTVLSTSDSTAPSSGALKQALQQQAAIKQLPQPDAFAAEYLKQSQLLQTRPPVTPGMSGNGFYTVVPHQILSWYPRIVLFPNFLDNSTAQHIIDLAKPRLEPSTLGVGSVAVAAPPRAQGEPEVRTSEGVFLDHSLDPTGVLSSIEEKIAEVSFIPPSHGEDFNVLRYRNGQHYHSHMDTFDNRFLKRMDPAFGQRVATMILYLSDVDEGGETVFKREGKYGAAHANSEHDLETCYEHDFKYKPRRGDAILFFSMNPDLTINPRALHGACPVRGQSEKWVATKWLHDKPISDWDGEA